MQTLFIRYALQVSRMITVRLQHRLCMMPAESTEHMHVSNKSLMPVSVTLQPIRVQSGPHQETAILHLIETEASTAELRGSAMHHRSSKHSLLFSSKGKLLHANKAAMDAYQQGSGDPVHSLLYHPCSLLTRLHVVDSC